jgi:hypothetical protein
MRISLRSAFLSFAALAAIASTSVVPGAMLAQDAAQGISQGVPQAAPQTAPAVAAAPEARAPIDAAWIGAWIGEAATPRLNGRAPILVGHEQRWIRPRQGCNHCFQGQRGQKRWIRQARCREYDHLNEDGPESQNHGVPSGSPHFFSLLIGASILTASDSI